MREVLSDDRETRLAQARASLREGWRLAEAAGLDKITDEEIDLEIARVRAMRDTPSAAFDSESQKPAAK